MKQKLLQAGENKNIDVKITKLDGTEVTGQTKVEAVPVSGYLGLVDIYYIAEEAGMYKITITPKQDGYTDEDKKEVIPFTKDVQAIKNTKVNSIEIGEFKAEATSIDASRFKTGDTRVSDLTFKHAYGIPGEGEDTDFVFSDIKPIYDTVDTVSMNTHSVEVLVEKYENGSWVELKTKASTDTLTANADVEYTLLTASGSDAGTYRASNITSVRLKALNDEAFSDEGTSVRVTVVVHNVPGVDSEVYSDISKNELKIYKASRSELTVTAQSKEPENIILSKREYEENGKYEIANIDGIWYTLVPIELNDQYTKGTGDSLNITKDMISTDKTEVKNGKIVVYDNINNANVSANKPGVKVISVIKNTSNRYIEAPVGRKVEYIGIAIGDDIDALENGWIRIFYGTNNDTTDKQVAEFTNISIKKLALSSVNMTPVGTQLNAECFKEEKVGVMTSGEGQDRLETGKISCIVIEKDSAGKEVKRYNITNAGTYKETGNDVGFTEKYEQNGNGKDILGQVGLYFWAKYDKNYTVIPYVGEYNKNKESEYDKANIEISANVTVSEIVFAPVDDEDMVGKTSVSAPTSAKTRFDVSFYHVYDEDKDNPRKIDKVDMGTVEYIKVSGPSGKDNNWGIYSVWRNTVSKDVTGAGTGMWTESVQVEIDNTIAAPTDPLKFKIKVGECESSVITVNVTERAEITRVVVGEDKEQQNIRIYHENDKPDSSKITYTDRVTNDKVYTLGTDSYVYYDYDPDTDEGMYYTLLPIKFMGQDSGGTQVEIISGELKEGNLNTELGNVDTENKISFVDNVNKVEIMFAHTSRIETAGFKKGSDGNITEADGTDILEYVGIAFKKGYDPETGEEDLFNPGEIYFVETIDVSYTLEGTSLATTTTTLYVYPKKAPNT